MSITVTHQGSRRVTASISYHSFTFTSPSPSLSPPLSTADGAPSSLNSSTRWLRPAQSVTLLFAKDLDPVNSLSENERCCTFTPCGTNNGQSLNILTRNGRITGLMGLPRPYQALTASTVDFGGGFSEPVLASKDVSDQSGVCIAGGTGIAPFLTMQDALSLKLSLFWSVRSDDFGLVEFLLGEKLLCTEKWAAVTVFVTSGQDSGGLVSERPASWWTTTFSLLRERYSKLRLEKRRITQEDIETKVKTVFYCGSKSLEWQIRMWSMGTIDVCCTEM